MAAVASLGARQRKRVTRGFIAEMRGRRGRRRSCAYVHARVGAGGRERPGPHARVRVRARITLSILSSLSKNREIMEMELARVW